jgi:hypothetical protein
MSPLRNVCTGGFPMRPRPVAVLAMAETVLCGLAVRHAHEGALHAALFLVPVAVGYRSVAASEERRQLGGLTPAAALLMMLGAAIAQGWAGLILATLWIPFAMVWALMGGALASLVRATCRGAAYVAARLTGREAAPPPTRPRRGSGGDVRDAWQQVIIRTPL